MTEPLGRDLSELAGLLGVPLTHLLLTLSQQLEALHRNLLVRSDGKLVQGHVVMPAEFVKKLLLAAKAGILAITYEIEESLEPKGCSEECRCEHCLAESPIKSVDLSKPCTEFLAFIDNLGELD